MPNKQKWPRDKRNPFFLKDFSKSCLFFFRAVFGAPRGRDLARMWPQRPAFEPRSIVQIRPVAARLVAKNAFSKNRISRKSFSARCISAYSECRNRLKPISKNSKDVLESATPTFHKPHTELFPRLATGRWACAACTIGRRNAWRAQVCYKACNSGKAEHI